MNVLLTGCSSPLGAGVLRCLLTGGAYTGVWCGVHRHDVPVSDPRLRRIVLHLGGEVDLNEIPAPLDTVIHFAAVTHAHDEQRYWEINYEGTMRLAASARERGCRRFVYISTRCATQGSGAYGESKLAAERGLLEMDWESLLILRPAEVYGGGGREGIDALMQTAKRLRVVPLLWGHKELRFAPLRADDFIAMTCALIHERRPGVHILDICGPEDLSGTALGLRIARQEHAIPIPVWWPAFTLALGALRRLGLAPVTRDQVTRLIGRKTNSRSTADPVLARPVTRFLLDKSTEH